MEQILKNGTQKFSVRKPTLIKMDKVLVVTKLSRLDYERSKLKNLNEKEIIKELIGRGTDYQLLLRSHQKQKNFEKEVVENLKKSVPQVIVANRFTLKEKQAEWADFVVAVGGDGTFLFAASHIKNNSKPVIGFNSDPKRSEGHLCLPKIYSSNITKAIEKLKNGEFDWFLRSRIRIYLYCQRKKLYPKYLHVVESPNNESNFVENNLKEREDGGILIPHLALNEVFIGESLSARVSHLQVYLNEENSSANVKSSGFCICTGTGSTSWHRSINGISEQTVSNLLRLVRDEIKNQPSPIDLANEYNQNLLFAPDDSRMCYSVRELISVGVWPQPKGFKERDFVNKIKVRSKCIDASLVIDGGVLYNFNDGAIAVLEINSEDALRTVKLTD